MPASPAPAQTSSTATPSNEDTTPAAAVALGVTPTAVESSAQPTNDAIDHSSIVGLCLWFLAVEVPVLVGCVCATDSPADLAADLPGLSLALSDRLGELDSRSQVDMTSGNQPVTNMM